MKARASKGGKARAKVLSPKSRSEIARKAAVARWGVRAYVEDPTAKATHAGVLAVGEMKFACAILEDGRRVLAQKDIAKHLGGNASKEKELPSYLSAKALQPFVSNSLRMILQHPIAYQSQNNHGEGNHGFGIEAVLLPEICEVWQKAREKKALHHTQQHIAQRAEILVHHFATQSIVALVDEATGYQDDCVRNEIAKLMQPYLREAFQKWAGVFPHAFYREVYQIHGWNYQPGAHHHPQILSQFLHDYVYRAVPVEVRHELTWKTPKVSSEEKCKPQHPFLTENTGVLTLDKIISNITVLVRVSNNPKQFQSFYHSAFCIDTK